MSVSRNHLFRIPLRYGLVGLSVALCTAGLACAQGINLGMSPPSAEEAAPKPVEKPHLSESVAALVNDDPISSYDLRQRMRLLVATSGVQPTEDNLPQIEREALRGLVDERLEMQEVKAIEVKQKDLKLEPAADEVDATIGDMAKQSGISRDQLLKTLKSDGVDARTLREQIAAQMSWNHYIGARFRDAVVIADNQVRSAMGQANAASLKPQYQLSDIFLDASTWADSRRPRTAPTSWCCRCRAGRRSGRSRASSRPCPPPPTAATKAGWWTAT